MGSANGGTFNLPPPPGILGRSTECCAVVADNCCPTLPPVYNCPTPRALPFDRRSVGQGGWGLIRGVGSWKDIFWAYGECLSSLVWMKIFFNFKSDNDWRLVKLRPFSQDLQRLKQNKVASHMETWKVDPLKKAILRINSCLELDRQRTWSHLYGL